MDDPPVWIEGCLMPGGKNVYSGEECGCCVGGFRLEIGVEEEGGQEIEEKMDDEQTYRDRFCSRAEQRRWRHCHPTFIMLSDKHSPVPLGRLSRDALDCLIRDRLLQPHEQGASCPSGMADADINTWFFDGMRCGYIATRLRERNISETFLAGRPWA